MPARRSTNGVGEILAGGRGDERRGSVGRGVCDAASGDEVEPGTELIGDDGGTQLATMCRGGAMLGLCEGESPLLAAREVRNRLCEKGCIAQAGAGEQGERDRERGADEVDGCAALAAAEVRARVGAVDLALLERQDNKAHSC